MRRTIILLGVLAATVVAWWFLKLNLVIGRSMAPTLEPWDICLSVRTRNYQPCRGDIISFRTADDPPMRFVKRVVGLPGETISIQGGQVLIDGKPLAEPYAEPNRSWTLPPTRIPGGRIYVLSDNRTQHFDDYVQGQVAARLVESRVAWQWRFKQ